MHLYADAPSLRRRQVLGDVLVGLWALLAVRAGLRVHELVSALGAPGRGLQDAGEGLTAGTTRAGDAVGRAPLVGRALRDAFGGLGGAGGSLADAGRAQVEAADRLATSLGLLVGLGAALVVLLPWVVQRVRQARRAAAVRQLDVSAAGRDLLAARALLTRTPAELLAACDDPAEGWRQGDPAVLASLASLELAAEGVAPAPGT